MWAKEQGFDYDKAKEKVEDNLAKQGSYILMNQLLFYKIIETEKVYSSHLSKLAPVEKLEQLPDRLESVFKNVVDNIDFKAVFEHDQIFNSTPMSESMAWVINEFIEELKEYDLTVFSGDVIGRIYEQLIPPKERHDLGQYYTPPSIVELIIRLAVNSPDAIILDPACGSGGFLVKAYRRLRELKSKNKIPTHEEILSQINGIDINRFPAHLSAINLAIQNISEKTDNVLVEVADFFDINPGQQRFARKTANLEGREREEDTPIPNKVDVVIANPPYIRQEKIQDKQKVRKHLEHLNLDLEVRADIYAYFFTHAYEFLRPNGLIGFITSDKWLDTKYGMQLAHFFLDNFMVKDIVKFDKQVFSDPLIGTVVTILQREEDAEKRNYNKVRLLRLKRNQSLDNVLSIIEGARDAETVYDTPDYRLAVKFQRSLQDEWKWLRYLYAPNIYFTILETGKIANLSTIANLTRGKVSGVNEFFYMTREEAIARGIEERYLTPIMKAIAQAEFVNFKREDTEWLCLDLHPFIETILKELHQERSIRDDRSITDVVKLELKKQSENLYVYIEEGETKGYHRRPTCRNRMCWFDIGEPLRPQFIFPDVYWKRTSVPYNYDRIAIDKQLYALIPLAGVDEFVLGGILNSDVNALMREMHGRTVGGEGLNRNQIMVWEAEEMPAIDPRRLSEDAKNRINLTFKNLLDKCRTASELELKEMRHELNIAVMCAIGLGGLVNELEAEVQRLIEIRVGGGGAQKDVMVEHEGEVRVTQLKGARLITQRATLDKFFEAS